MAEDEGKLDGEELSSEDKGTEDRSSPSGREDRSVCFEEDIVNVNVQEDKRTGASMIYALWLILFILFPQKIGKSGVPSFPILYVERTNIMQLQ